MALRLLIGSEVLPPALAGVLWEGWGLHLWLITRVEVNPKLRLIKKV